jgi:hypothetical protein
MEAGNDSKTSVNSATQYAIPEVQTLAEAGELEILDEQGNKLPFKSLYVDRDRSLIVFIRHFFCGVRSVVFLPKAYPC